MKPEQIYNISFISKILRQKVFQFDGEFLQYYTGEDNNFEFKYRVNKVDDIKMMIHTGEWKPVVFLEVVFFDLNDRSNRLFKQLMKVVDNNDGLKQLLNVMGGPSLNRMKSEIHDYLKMSIGFDGSVDITSFNFRFDEPKNITESRAHRVPIQTMVKDVVKVLKTKGVGEYYLPEDISNEMTYIFPKVKDISVELKIKKDNSINGFAVNGNYVKDDDIIEVLIVLNPKENINQMLYDIVGELNDLFAHELEHFRQYKTGEFKLGSNEDIDDPLVYYTRPEEIKAQIKGFKRLSKMRRIPLEITIKNWFDTHEDIHHLNKNDKQKVINTLLQNS